MERKKKGFSKQKPGDESLEKIYGKEGKDGNKKDLQKINVPKEKKESGPLFRMALAVLILVFVGFGAWYMFFRGTPTASKQGAEDGVGSWYSVKLVSNEIFYGQIFDTKADPIVIENVYYNYEQAKDEKKAVDETASLKLVKRGKETHGPTGAMNVVRSQVIYMEPLGDDSKVLRAILEYEK